MITASELYSQAMSLPVEERQELAHRLLDSVPYDEESPLEVSDELVQEIERRIADHAAGTAKTVDLETFIATIRAAANPSEAK